MKIILALTILISLPHLPQITTMKRTVSDGSYHELKLDENMEISDADTTEMKLDENMEISDVDTIEIRLDEDMEKPGKVKERMMNNPNYLMNRKECKEVKDGVAGLLSMSDGIWKEIKKDPEDKDKWAEVMALI